MKTPYSSHTQDSQHQMSMPYHPVTKKMLYSWGLNFLTFEYDLCTQVRDSHSKVCFNIQIFALNKFFFFSFIKWQQSFLSTYDRWIHCRSLLMEIRLFRPILIDIAIKKNSPGNIFAFWSFVHLQTIYVRFDLCCLRNDSRVCPGTLLSKNRRTAWVAIFWHR